MTSRIMKKSFGLPRGQGHRPQDDGTSQGCDPGAGHGKTSTTAQECTDSLDQQPESSTDNPIHPVHTRSTNNSSSASIDVQVDSTVQVPDEQQEEPLSLSNDTSVKVEPTAHEVQTPGNDEQHGEQQPAAEKQPISEPDTAEATQVDHPTASPERTHAPLGPPIPPPARNGRAKSPRKSGLKSFTVQIEPQYHARVKKAARDHGIPVKRMVVMMIENCFPEN
jgi:hypothetical protein